MGAWDTYYQKETPLKYGNNDPYGYACVSIKKELAWNGFDIKGMIVGSQVIGEQASEAIVAFQKFHDLESDGIVGPHTALVLYRRRSQTVQVKYKIPDNLVCKIKTLESDNDPGAVGVVDPHDHGLVQINSVFHPDITLEQTEDGAFSLDFCGKSLSQIYESWNDWDVAVASWNVGPTNAIAWAKAGKPSTGTFIFTTAYNYVNLVKGQAC